MTARPPQRIHPDLTVALCTFNGARHIVEQVSSLLDQDLLPAVIVVSDDSSDDDTLERIRDEWRRRSDRVGPALRILPPPDGRLGPARNFERAIEAARTALVALCDQDDVWEPSRLAITVRRLEEADRPLLVAGNTRLVDGRGQDLGGDSFSRFGLTGSEREQAVLGDPLPALVRRNFLQGMTFTMRTELARLAGPAPEPFLHDYWLALVAAASGRLALIDAPLVSYRLHDANAVGAGDRLAVLRLLRRAHWTLVHPRHGVPRRLTEWNGVARWLGAVGVLPDPQRMLLTQKVRFERARFRGSRTCSTQWRVVVGLARRGEYRRFDRDGLAACIDDLLWRRGSDESESARSAGQEDPR